jgi:hypothetical protein
MGPPSTLAREVPPQSPCTLRLNNQRRKAARLSSCRAASSSSWRIGKDIRQPTCRICHSTFGRRRVLEEVEKQKKKLELSIGLQTGHYKLDQLRPKANCPLSSLFTSTCPCFTVLQANSTNPISSSRRSHLSSDCYCSASSFHSYTQQIELLETRRGFSRQKRLIEPQWRKL